ncbi:dUTP diphosphatase [Patescibacteria group bacterium]|nr:dUTP diphosphatase [Patescibacteria group bacterium]
MLKVKIKRLHPETKLPTYAHPGDAGLDMYSIEDTTISPGGSHHFFCGFALEFPEGYMAIVKDKGGLGTKGLHALGGVFDAGFRGEYNVFLVNLGKEPYHFEKGDKIAQLLIMPVECAELIEADTLSETSRGKGQFGSTGRR